MSTWQEREQLATNGYRLANRLLAKKLKVTRKKLLRMGHDAKMARRILQQVIYHTIGS